MEEPKKLKPKERLKKMKKAKLERSYLQVESNRKMAGKGIIVFAPLVLFRKGLIRLPIKSVNGLKKGDFVIYQGNSSKKNRTLRAAAAAVEYYLKKGERCKIIEINSASGEIVVSPAI